MDRITNTRDPFADLNPAQREAVDHRGGPLLVIAGAGSGKTKTLSARVAKLLKDGADPQRILMLTFSRRAASDMARRVSQNAFVESFNGRLRDELLNETLIRSLTHARQMLGAWRDDYNHHRPHSKLGWLTPAQLRSALDTEH